MPVDGTLNVEIRTSHLSAGNDGASQRSTQKVPLLVDGIALNSAEAELLNELLAEVLDDPVVCMSVTGLEKY